MLRNYNELKYWVERYNTEEDLYNTGLEEKLNKKFNDSKKVTKKDLVNIVTWKFQGRLKGRRQRILNIMENTSSETVEKISSLAFSTKDEKARIAILCTLDGVGPAIASVILTFYDPKKYGIFDIHVWRELFGEENAGLFTVDNYLKTLFKIREIANIYNVSCREVEKALFKKNLEESKKRE